MADRVIQRNDTAARWKEVNPVLAMGEIGIETDGAKGYKIGDGVTAWNDLAYPANPTSVVQETGDGEGVVMSQKAVSEKLAEVGSYVESQEYVRAYVDSDNRFLWGIKRDGSVEFAKGVPTSIRKYINKEIERLNQLIERVANDVSIVAETYSFITNKEYVFAIVDADNRILLGLRTNGSLYVQKGMSEDIKDEIERINARISEYEETYYKEDNPEYLRAEIDKEGKVLSCRDKDGVAHEYKMIIKELTAKKILLSDDNAEEIKSALNRIGFTIKSPNDFSEKSTIELPIPRVCASVRLIVPRMPTTKTADIEGYLEYYDKDGNYFKKAIILNSQGSSSMGYIRPDGSQGNLSVDFADCEIKFGNWVAQDSFHIKKYYIDAFRGQCVVGYHLMEQVYQTHPYGEKKPYDTILQNDSITDSFGKIKKDFNTGALCHPDGFPVVIYVNTGGEDIFYGVYAWCLKKHRDNYYCTKDNANHIILDGVINVGTLFGGNIDWEEFEIRNPKDLIDINGNEYDGESPKELSNSDELSAAVKANIIRLSGVSDALSANPNKDTFEQYFLSKHFIDWFLVSQITYNIDGFSKNWIWCTWDGQHWAPTIYDVDSIFGAMPIGTYVDANSSTKIITETITNHLKSIYTLEIEDRYKELRDKGVFSTENITGLLNSWLDRIGYQNLKDDLERYDQTPSYRKSYLNDEIWEILSYSWNTANNDYDNDATYEVGDTCYSYGYKLRAKIKTSGIPPFSQVYSNHPQANGFFNSLVRVKNWLDKRIAYLDSVYKYNV